MNRKNDYVALEREYITGDMSIRELGRRHGINNHSVIASQARDRQWARKRKEYLEQAAEKAVVYMADEEGARRAREMRVRDNAIDAIDEVITKLRLDMHATRKLFVDNKWVEEPLMVIEPKDVAMLIDRLNVLFGRPANITEERSLGVNFTGTGPDLLRSIVEATQGVGSLAGGAASSPIPRTGGAREN